MISLSGKCEHSMDAHEVIAGVRLSDGSFKSRQTTEYPPSMCDSIAQIISPLCKSSATILDLPSVTSLIPTKGLHDLPVSDEDGGGLFSQPDWSRSFRIEQDIFDFLRIGYSIS